VTLEDPDNEYFPFKDYQTSGIPEILGYLSQDTTEEQGKKLKKQDSYGYKKLMAERYII
jgi:hypothetical protein